MKLRRVGRVLANISAWTLGVACVGFLLAVGIGPRTGRYATLTVLSGSMRPAIPVGAIVVVTPQRPDQIRVGQVITYRIPEGDRQVVSHRVVEIVRDGDRPVIRTQGDANESPDPWLAEVDDDTVWRVRYTLPAVGRVINLLRQPLAHRITVFIVPVVLALVWLVDIWRPDGDTPATVMTGPST